MTQQPARQGFSWFALGFSLLALVALIYLVATHFGEAEHFAQLLQKAQPWWLAAALALQVCTYICVALIWRLVADCSDYQIALPVLMRLAVQKVSLDQILPSGGFSGNFVTLGALRKLGLPGSLAGEMLLADMISRCCAYACVGLSVFGILLASGHLSALSATTLPLFVLVMLAIPGGIWLLLLQKRSPLARRLLLVRPLRKTMQALSSISARKIFAPSMLWRTSLLQLLVILIDSATLLAALLALGQRPSIAGVYIAYAGASIAGIISLLPAGLGSFEAVCTASLHGFGLPVEAALAGTLLLRGFTLWLPLLPGLILARAALLRPARARDTAGDKKAQRNLST